MALENWNFGISLLVFLFIAKKIWNVLYTFWIGPATIKVDIKSRGQWAMVTGSTDGIGKEYARQLAARGCDIILVSRSLDKLKNVASEIEKEFKVQTKIVQIDFTGDASIYDKLAKEIEGLEIGTLVNNVGLSYPYLEYFLELPNRNKLLMDMINVNVVSTTLVTSLVLPGMVKRGKGIIINIGSASNDVQSPLLAAYSAVKAFVAKFSDGLRYEYGSKDIIIQCISPSIVSTNMSGVDSSFMFPSAETYVKSALRMLGSAHRSNGYFPHSCLIFLYNSIEFLSEDLGAWFSKSMSELAQVVMLKRLGIMKNK